MRKRGFEATRLALFAKSYAGYYFAQKIKESNNPQELIKKLSKTLLFNEHILGFFLTPQFSSKEVNKVIKDIVDDRDKIKVYLKN